MNRLIFNSNSLLVMKANIVIAGHTEDGNRFRGAEDSLEALHIILKLLPIHHIALVKKIAQYKNHIGFM